MRHELKIYPEWYNGLLSGLKTFEVRKDDREPKFAPNDELFLREFDGDKYTGRTMSALVRFVLRGKYCKDGYCIMSVEVLSSYPPKPMTNYDRIKAMNVEEMAEMLLDESESHYTYCNGCQYQSFYAPHCSAGSKIKDGCLSSIQKWLMSEVESNDT